MEKSREESRDRATSPEHNAARLEPRRVAEQVRLLLVIDVVGRRVEQSHRADHSRERSGGVRATRKSDDMNRVARLVLSRDVRIATDDACDDPESKDAAENPDRLIIRVPDSVHVFCDLE